MIDYAKIRNTVVELLKAHTGYEIVLANQAAHIPAYPYISFTVTSPMIANNGTYGRYDDGYDRKPITQVWSFTAQAKTTDEAAIAAHKAHDFFDRFYNVLSDNEIVVTRLGNIANRDNFLTVNYEYRCGFDVTLGLMNEIDRSELNEGEITDVTINTINIERDEENVRY